MTEAYNVLYQKIKDFAIEEIKQHKGFNKHEITSVFMSSSSYVRKSYTMQRINDIINELKLPLVIMEDDLEFTPLFQIKAK